MQFSNYPAFRNAVHQLLDGDDISQSDLSVPVLDLLIAAGENRIYREIRTSTQDVALSLTITSNVGTLPSDFIELKTLYVAGYKPPTYQPYEVVQGLIQKSGSTFLGPLRYTFEGDTIIFFPSLDGVTASGRYYKRFPDVSTGLNALINRHPDLFIYAALSESAPFLGETTRLQMWETKYLALAQLANETERRRVTRGSKLQTRVA